MPLLLGTVPVFPPKSVQITEPPPIGKKKEQGSNRKPMMSNYDVWYRAGAETEKKKKKK